MLVLFNSLFNLISSANVRGYKSEIELFADKLVDDIEKIETKVMNVIFAYGNLERYCKYGSQGFTVNGIIVLIDQKLDQIIDHSNDILGKLQKLNESKNKHGDFKQEIKEELEKLKALFNDMKDFVSTHKNAMKDGAWNQDKTNEIKQTTKELVVCIENTYI